MIFNGTAVTYGRGRAVVVATGMQTQMGRIAGMLKAAPAETTPLQKELGIIESGRAIRGAEFEKVQDDATRLQTVREVSVYARVNPETQATNRKSVTA